MNNWKNISVNIQNIKKDNGSSVLISMPHSSRFDGYSFWHPAKCVHSGNNSYAVSIGYTDSWEFKLKKYGKGKYNKYDVIDEVSVSGEEMEEAFSSSQASTQPKDYHKPIIEVVEPEYKKPEEVEVAEGLKCD